MKPAQVDHACKWIRQVFPTKMIHALVSRAVARMPGTSEGLTLYEVAQRCSPQKFASLLEPPSIRELFLEELLTSEQDGDILPLPFTYKESCDGENCTGEQGDGLG